MKKFKCGGVHAPTDVVQWAPAEMSPLLLTTSVLGVELLDSRPCNPDWFVTPADRSHVF